MPAIPASRVEVFDVVVPAGTLRSAPLETPTPWQQAELVGIEIFIPDGHSGLTGIRLALAHSQAIPHTAGAWIVGNDETLKWDTAGYPNSGAWSVIAYNEDNFTHTFYVRYLVADFAFTPQALAGAAAVVPELS